MLAAALADAGFVYLWWHDRRAWTWVTAPAVATGIASALGIYPVRGRPVLFLIPFAFLLCAQGFDSLARRRGAPLLGILLVAVILGRPAWNRAEEALRPDPGSPVPALLAHIRAGWREGDGIFVYDGAQYVFEYYAPRFGFEPVDSIVGVSERKVPERFLPQLEELRRYRRVWILFAHVWRSDHFSTVQWFLHRLNRMGRLRGSLELKRASVFLYDLEGRDAGPSPPSGQ